MGSHRPQGWGPTDPTCKNKENIRIKRKSSACAASVDAGCNKNQNGDTPHTLEEIELEIQTVKAASKVKRDAKTKAGRPLRKDGTGFLPTKPALTLLWSDLLREHYPHSKGAALSVRSQSILWNYGRSWTLASGSGEFVAYLTWTVERWSAIRRVGLHWMDEPPLVPSLALVLSAKLRHIFEDAYNHATEIERWQSLDPRSRAIEDLVRLKGYDHATATELVDAEGKHQTQVRELARAKMALESLRRAFEDETRQREARIVKAHLEGSRRSKRQTPLQNPEGDFGAWQDED